MRKSDLKNGMVVEYKSGKRRLYLDGLLFDENLTERGQIDSYNEFLIIEGNYSNLNIVKVFKDYRALKSTDKENAEQDLLLWEREEEIEWSEVAIDTPILVRDCGYGDWLVRHFAGLNELGEVTAWIDGKTSYTIEREELERINWKQAKLVNNENK